MSKIRYVAFCLAMVLCSHFFASVQQDACNNGMLESQSISFEQLAEAGPGLNEFVELQNCYPGDAFLFGNEKYSSLYVPVFESSQSAIDDKSVKVVLRYGQCFTDDNVEELLTELDQPGGRVQGMAKQTLSSGTSLFDYIEEAYPDHSFEGALILDVGQAPVAASYAWMLAGHFVATLVAFVGIFLACLICKQPESVAGKIGLVLGGVVLSGSSLAYLLTRPFDLSTPELLQQAAALEGVASIGIGCVVTGVLLLAFKNQILEMNPFARQEIFVENDTLNIVKGKRVRQFPVDSIDVISFLHQLEKSGVSGERPDFKLCIESQGETAKASGFLEPGQGVEMQAQIDKVVSRLADRYMRQLIDGHVVAFENWTVAGDLLTINEKKTENKQLRLDQLTEVKQVDSKFNIWVSGNERHAAQIDVTGENSEVLCKMLDYFIDLNQAQALTSATQDIFSSGPGQYGPEEQGRRQSNQTPEGCSGNRKDAATGSPMGNLIFEEEQNHLNGYAVAAVAVAVGIGVAIWINPLIGLAVGGFGAMVGFYVEIYEGSGKKQFSIYEKGVCLKKKSGLTEIAYDDAEDFSFNRTHVYHNGAYQGTRFEFEFRKSIDEGKPEIIKLSSSAKTEQFNLMQQAAMEQMGMSLAARLADADRVEWIPGCWIYKDGFEAPVRSVLKSNVEKVQWSRVSEIAYKDSSLLIKIDQSNSVSFKLNTSKSNFYPGLFLFEKLLEMNHVDLEKMDSASMQEPMVT